MRIVGFETTVSVMRKEDPNWRFALGASPVTEGHVLRIAMGKHEFPAVGIEVL